MTGTAAGRSEARAIQSALRTTTETLAHSLARGVAPTPDWSDYEWRVAKAAAAIHGVAPLLCALPDWRAPTEWTRFLREQRQHTLDRHRRTENLLAAIDTRAQDEGFPVVALKGAALHALGLYRAGERPMADVDLLVAHADAGKAARLLQWLGFRKHSTTWKHQAYVAESAGGVARLGEHADNYLKVEVHTGIGEALPLRVAHVTELIFPAAPVAGLNPYPSRAALMAHLLLHAAGSMTIRALRLMHLHDIALLSAAMTGEDWDTLLGWSTAPAGERGRGHWWALPPLELAARYYPGAIPARVLDRLSCSWLLRQVTRRRSLSDVSPSYLWVDAFPGIEWSRSTAEMVRYAANRIRPSPQMLALRRSWLESEGAGAQSQWQHLSQGRRILRWVISKPARDQTLHVVRAALAGAP